MGLVPKPHQPNKFRLIVDLSAPIDNSVNDGIPSDFCSLRYASVDDAVAMVRVLGRGTMLAKIDIKDAYRLIPVHPDDYHLLGITWRGQTYVDRALPFGLCSAPKISSAVADFISWVLHRHNIPHQLHYLDDFLFLGTPHSEEAGNVLEVITKVLRMLGIPIAVHKTEGPNTVLTFLGSLLTPSISNSGCQTINLSVYRPSYNPGHLRCIAENGNSNHLLVTFPCSHSG